MNSYRLSGLTRLEPKSIMLSRRYTCSLLSNYSLQSASNSALALSQLPRLSNPRPLLLRAISAWTPQPTERIITKPEFVPVVALPPQSANATPSASTSSNSHSPSSSSSALVPQQQQSAALIDDAPDLSCLFQSPSSMSRKNRHKLELMVQRYQSLFPETWVRNVAPRVEGFMLTGGVLFLLLCAAGVHFLPGLGLYDLARDVLTLSVRFTGLVLVAQMGVQMGINLSRYGWAPKLTRLQCRYSLIRCAYLGIFITPALLVVATADFLARDAAYLSCIVAVGLTLLDYVMGRMNLQPAWFFPYIFLFRLWMVTIILVSTVSERATTPGRQIELIKRVQKRPFQPPILESGEKLNVEDFLCR